MFRNVLALAIAAAAMIFSHVAAADTGGFASLFQRAMIQGKSGNGFAAGYSCSTAGATTTCTSPYGGSLTQSYEQWNGNSGSTSWSYNNFTISAAGVTMTINGTFNYQGSISPSGILSGTMAGNLVYDITTPAMNYGGYSVPATTQHLTIVINATFGNGMATVNLTANGQSSTVSWSQTQLLGYLY